MVNHEKGMFKNRIFINKIHEDYKKFIDKEIVICGMIETIRKQSEMAFINLNDGTCLKDIQIVMNKSADNGKNFTSIFEKGTKGTIMSVRGKIIKSPAKGQDFEMIASNEIDFFDCINDGAKYPISKNRNPLETIRKHLHLRMRTRALSSVTRIRNSCSILTHEFFQNMDFQYIHTPILTCSDCEGAGETFTVTNLLPEKIDKQSKIEGYEKDFFGEKTSLTVSGQLNVECYAMYFSKVYTFGPTFRAENSNTSRHLAEFWMIEPEITYINLDELMDIAESYLKYCVNGVLLKNPDEINLFNKYMSKGLIDKLKSTMDNNFIRITYTDAVNLYNEKNENKIKWGDDLPSEVEKYICETIFNRPTIIYNYPKEIKAFYMKNNADNKTVQAFDVLVPGIGEIIGGSIREENYEVLKNKIIENKISVDSLNWYLDLRKFGTCPHGGFGLGFERLIMYTTGISNIRDTIPFPRYPNHCDY